MANRPKTFPGTHVDVHWDGRLCIHVGECVRAQSDLFVADRKPWATPDAVESWQAAANCERCPTGALTYTPKDDTEPEEADEHNTIVVANDGPLYVRGELKIEGAKENMDGVRYRAALCRCGQSANKPFCDGSHSKAGFRDSGAVGNEDPRNGEKGGVLEVTPSLNGPLMLTGNVTLVTGAGRVAWSGKKAALCRCGQSGNKPFCDGSHKRVGFEAG